MSRQLQSVSLRDRQSLGEPRNRAFLPRLSGRRSAVQSCGRRVVREPKTAARGRDAGMARLEAVLLLASEPLSSRKIGQFASLADGTEARTLIRRLNRLYDSQGSAFRVEEVAGGFQLLTRPKFGGWLRRLHPTSVETRLSGPALETLALVAYRQPVVRAEIESIRGVQCGEMLRQLMERDLVRISGRCDELGRPFLYGTTKRFLQVFGLRSLDELPRAQALRRAPPQDIERRPQLAAGRDNDLTPISDSNEESEVKLAATPELAPEDLLNPRTAAVLAGAAGGLLPRAADDDLADDDLDDDDDDDDDLDDDDDDDDLEEDDDLEDDEWEEVDDDDEEWDEDDDEDEDDDDWDDDEDDEDDDDEEEDWVEGE
ncbi:MAG TPA: SMC-Scp complex subunit ScpB [Pirellulales bacterium]|nr:SMC-Scp complex subunit ScpB [Pirellulales bacterium]